jgi:hypothetical protein
MKSIFYIILAFFSTGCASDALDRSQAGSIIADFYDYPIIEIVTIRTENMGDPSDIESQLVNQGYLYREASMNKEEAYDYHLTEKGKTFSTSEDSDGRFNMVGSDLTFNEVTGIRTMVGEKKAVVDFTEKRSNITVFGKITEYMNPDLVEKQVSMELYDDGWRITTTRTEISVTSENPSSDTNKDNPDETTKLKTSTTENNKSGANEDDMEDESLVESSASFFLLKKAFTEQGEDFVAVDYIGEDGTNNNNKLRIFKITQEFNTLDKCGRFPNSGKIKDFNDLISIEKDSLKLFIVVVDDIVRCIELTETPEIQAKPIENTPIKPRSHSTNETLEDSTNLSAENTNQRQLKDTIPKAPEN